MPEKGVIPSGSMPVSQLPDNQGNKSDGGAKDGKDGSAGTKPAKDDSYLGSWKTKDDASKGLQELQKKLDSQGTEVGSLRKQNKDLFDAFRDVQKSQAPAGDKSASSKSTTGDELQGVMAEYGKIDFVEDAEASKKGAALMQQAIGLTAKMVKEDTLSEAGAQVQNLLQEKDANVMMDKFHQANPDFAGLQEQGAFQALKDSNPLHDDFSAFYEHQSQESAGKISELETALEEAKKVANLAGGDDRTSKVFSKPGGDLRGGNKSKPQSVSELKQSALQTIRNMTGAG